MYGRRDFDEIPDSIQPYWDNLKRVLPAITDIQLIESPVYCKQAANRGWAGTPDVCGRWRGELCVIDIKTAAKKKRKQWIESHNLQVTAYAIAITQMFGVKVETGVILITTLEGVQIFEFSIQDYAWSWQSRVDKYFSQLQQEGEDESFALDPALSF